MSFFLLYFVCPCLVTQIFIYFSTISIYFKLLNTLIYYRTPSRAIQYFCYIFPIFMILSMADFLSSSLKQYSSSFEILLKLYLKPAIFKRNPVFIHAARLCINSCDLNASQINCFRFVSLIFCHKYRENRYVNVTASAIFKSMNDNKALSVCVPDNRLIS